MYWRRAAALLLTVAAFDEAAAKLITVTEHASACSAVYTSASRSVTVVKSTITVSPIPWTDNSANSGTPFVLEIGDSSPAPKRKRQMGPKLWLMANGDLTTDGSKAAHYVIENGRLTTAHGGLMSTAPGDKLQLFAITNNVKPIQRSFMVKDYALDWDNTEFSGGAARFYRNGVHVIAVFKTMPIPNWTPIKLSAQPVSDATAGGSGGGMSSVPISTAISTGSMSPLPGSTGGHGGQSSPSGTKATSGSPSASSPVSPDGICGPESGYSCAAGKCCSSYGYCGTGGVYCGAGCRPEFGTCWAQSAPSQPGAASTSPGPATSSVSGGTSSAASNGGSSKSSLGSSVPMSGGSTMPGSPSSTPSHASSLMSSHSVSASPMSTYTATGTPIGGNNPGLSPTISSRSTGMSMSSSQGQMSSMNPMSVSNPATTSSSAQMGSTSALISSYSMSMPAMSRTSSSAMPSRTLPVSPNGHCGTQGNGGTSQGYTCSGSVFGMCCSNSGFCGNTTDYCLAGCQAAYGSCTAQTGNPITVSGHCGTSAGDQTCTGGIFGPCCSISGFCGTTVDYCAPGNCNPMFGTCNSASSSTMQMSSTSMSMPISSSTPSSAQMMSSSPSSMMSSSQLTSSVFGQMMSSSQTMSSSSSQPTSSSVMSMASSSSTRVSSSSSATPTSLSNTMMSSSSSPSSSAASSSSSSSSMMATTTTSSSSRTSSSGTSTSSSATPSSTSTTYNPTCPAYNGTGFTDTMGNTYVVLCDRNTNPGAFASSTEADFASCINACSGQTGQQCVAVTYVGGNCYFKSAYTGDPSSPGTNAAVLASVLGQAPISYNPSQSTSASSMSSQTSSASSQGSTITSAPTSSSSMMSSTSSTSTSTGPYLVLTSPTPCDFGDPPGYDEDDSYCEIDLPFAMRVYAQTSTQTYASTNGYLSIQQGSSQYEAMQFPTDTLPNNTVAPFFDDLYLYGGQTPMQGIFYQFNPAQTAISYEYYLQRAGNNGAPYHFIIAYDSAVPGVFTYTYYSAGPSIDDGVYAAVGMQGIDGSGTEQGFTYSYQVADITPGLVVSCNTQTGTCTTVSSGGKLIR